MFEQFDNKNHKHMKTTQPGGNDVTGSMSDWWKAIKEGDR